MAMRSIFLHGIFVLVALSASNAVASGYDTPAPSSDAAEAWDGLTAKFATPAPGTLGYALLKGTPTLDARYRFEQVDQDGIHRDADASTLRTRVGYITGNYAGFLAGIELQNISDVGAEHFNNTLNGETRFPVVADPRSNRLNQLYLGFQDNDITKTNVTLGRQLITLDNQRFVGSMDWWQSDQTFDAVSFTNTYIDHLKLFYAYIDRVNRVFTDESTAPVANIGIYDSHSHLINLSYEVAPPLKVTGYTYLLDFANAPASSDATYGMRFTGEHPLDKTLTLSYALEGAHQTDYANNPASISENYYLVEPAASAFGLTIKPGYEVLEGNGATAFQTPLASFHSFDGWADKFLTTPANGLENRYVSFIYKVPFGEEYLLKDSELTTTYHDWSPDHGSGTYGTEWDGSISQTFFNHYTLGVELAEYKADHLFTDTTKISAWLTIKF